MNTPQKVRALRRVLSDLEANHNLSEEMDELWSSSTGTPQVTVNEYLMSLYGTRLQKVFDQLDLEWNEFEMGMNEAIVCETSYAHDYMIPNCVDGPPCAWSELAFARECLDIYDDIAF